MCFRKVPGDSTCELLGMVATLPYELDTVGNTDHLAIQKYR